MSIWDGFKKFLDVHGRKLTFFFWVGNLITWSWNAGLEGILLREPRSGPIGKNTVPLAIKSVVCWVTPNEAAGYKWGEGVYIVSFFLMALCMAIVLRQQIKDPDFRDRINRPRRFR